MNRDDKNSFSDLDFVRSFPRPVPPTPPELAKLLNSLEGKEGTPQTTIDLKRGQRVRIKEGPFANYEASVEETFPYDGLVRLVVSIRGRRTPITLDHRQVAKV